MAKRSEQRTEFLTDVLTTAVEGGIGYWARIYESERDPNLGWTKVTLVDYEDAANDMDLDLSWSYEALDKAYEDGKVPAEHVHTVTLDTVASAVGKVAKGNANVCDQIVKWVAEDNRENEVTNIDAWAADVVIQVAALGEVVYG